jgi:hypothetical protein
MKSEQELSKVIASIKKEIICCTNQAFFHGIKSSEGTAWYEQAKRLESIIDRIKQT